MADDYIEDAEWEDVTVAIVTTPKLERLGADAQPSPPPPPINAKPGGWSPLKQTVVILIGIVFVIWLAAPQDQPDSNSTPTAQDSTVSSPDKKPDVNVPVSGGQQAGNGVGPLGGQAGNTTALSAANADEPWRHAIFSCQTVSGKVVDISNDGKMMRYTYGRPDGVPDLSFSVPRADVVLNLGAEDGGDDTSGPRLRRNGEGD